MKFFYRLYLNVALSGSWPITHDNSELRNDLRHWDALNIMGLG